MHSESKLLELYHTSSKTSLVLIPKSSVKGFASSSGYCITSPHLRKGRIVYFSLLRYAICIFLEVLRTKPVWNRRFFTLFSLWRFGISQNHFVTITNMSDRSLSICSSILVISVKEEISVTNGGISRQVLNLEGRRFNNLLFMWVILIQSGKLRILAFSCRFKYLWPFCYHQALKG